MFNLHKADVSIAMLHSVQDEVTLQTCDKIFAFRSEHTYTICL